jgi:hypothetical protein
MAMLTLAGTSGCAVSLMGDSRAESEIAQQGAAVSKPIPDVRVFVARTSDHREKRFGDAQLLAILPTLGRLHRFNELDVSRTSVTNASVSQLKGLQSLEVLNVAGTPVTVVGLLPLMHLRKLRLVIVAPGQLSESDLVLVRPAFPNVRVWVTDPNSW